MASLRDFVDPQHVYREAYESRKNLLTCGSFATEEEAAAFFDSLVSPQDWIVYKEVEGASFSPNIFSKSTGKVRIDRVLVPTGRLEESWNNGPVGVEIKRSGKPIGDPVSQIIDYLNCVFTLPGSNYCVLKNIFLFPFFLFPTGPFGSLLAQRRVGFASHINYRKTPDLRFYLGGNCVYSQTEGGRLESWQRSGQKFGSR